ncbi:hypothetical protein L6452_07358 [Arctium lappa]|uniref:Uncharacterized protein n=1 Tax=Arctium lappa TaxID=4217 RepID=A0ACB9EM01_ARCLA|nr:hypothetical protein L6452_07358 [Arctium lappa]
MRSRNLNVTKTIRCEEISSQTPKKLTKTRPSKTPLFSVKNLAISAASGILFHVAFKNPYLIGIGGGHGGGGAGGGGGGGGGGLWKRVLSPAANLKKFSPFKTSIWEKRKINTTPTSSCEAPSSFSTEISKIS